MAAQEGKEKKYFSAKNVWQLFKMKHEHYKDFTTYVSKLRVFEVGPEPPLSNVVLLKCCQVSLVYLHLCVEVHHHRCVLVEGFRVVKLAHLDLDKDHVTFNQTKSIG